MEATPLGSQTGVARSAAEAVVYGTRWCAGTQMVRRWLTRQGILHSYVDLEATPGAADQLRWLTGGSASHPTVIINGEILVEPSLSELAWTLRAAV